MRCQNHLLWATVNSKKVTEIDKSINTRINVGRLFYTVLTGSFVERRVVSATRQLMIGCDWGIPAIRRDTVVQHWCMQWVAVVHGDRAADLMTAGHAGRAVWNCIGQRRRPRCLIGHGRVAFQHSVVDSCLAARRTATSSRQLLRSLH